MATVDLEVRGLIETQAEMTRIIRDLHGAPLLDSMRDATLIVLAGTKKNMVGYESPEVGGVDTGRTRASYTPEVRLQGNSVEGVVGSNLKTALWQETGTRPHWPPIAALETWARRHGTEAFLVARAIARRGTKARKPLTRAFEDNRQRIINTLERGVHDIIERKR